jgi:phospholipase/carboxylesterase
LNAGYVMRAWYDVVTLDFKHEDAEGIRQSQSAVCELIAGQLEQGIAAEHLLLAGFSQGGAIALHTGLRYPQRLGGIIALSTYLPLAASLQQEAAAQNQQIPIFMAHGTHDATVTYPTGKQSCNQLQTLGYKVDWREYYMAHSVCNEEIKDLGGWLTSLLRD